MPEKGRGHHKRLQEAALRVLQVSLLAQLLFALYATDMPTGILVAQYAEDMAVLYRAKRFETVVSRLQSTVDELGE